MTWKILELVIRRSSQARHARYCRYNMQDDISFSLKELVVYLVRQVSQYQARMLSPVRRGCRGALVGGQGAPGLACPRTRPCLLPSVTALCVSLHFCSTLSFSSVLLQRLLHQVWRRVLSPSAHSHKPPSGRAWVSGMVSGVPGVSGDCLCSAHLSLPQLPGAFPS